MTAISNTNTTINNLTEVNEKIKELTTKYDSLTTKSENNNIDVNKKYEDLLKMINDSKKTIHDIIDEKCCDMHKKIETTIDIWHIALTDVKIVVDGKYDELKKYVDDSTLSYIDKIENKYNELLWKVTDKEHLEKIQQFIQDNTLSVEDKLTKIKQDTTIWFEEFNNC